MLSEVGFFAWGGMMSIQQDTQLVEKPTREQVEKQLDRILDSRALQKRGAAFLKFVVEETLAGRSDYLKAFTLATVVFGRDASFDPQNDPLVRFEAGVLRRSLERYYLLYGVGDMVDITLPKGGYRPAFNLRAVSQAARSVLSDNEASVQADVDTPPEAPSSRILSAALGMVKEKHVRKIALGSFATCLIAFAAMAMLAQLGAVTEGAESFQNPIILVGEDFAGRVGGTGDDPSTGDFRDEMILQLVSRRDLTVRVANVAGVEEAQYSLSGTVRKDGRTYRMSGRLTRRGDGAVIWAGSRDRADGNLRAATEEAAFDFAGSIADRLGQSR